MTIAVQKSPIRVRTVIKQGKITSYFDVRDVKPGGTVAKRAKPEIGIIIRESVRQSKH